jgi:hypothetical protein
LYDWPAGGAKEDLGEAAADNDEAEIDEDDNKALALAQRRCCCLAATPAEQDNTGTTEVDSSSMASAGTRSGKDAGGYGASVT